MHRFFRTFLLKNRIILKRFRAVIIGYFVLVTFVAGIMGTLGLSGYSLLSDQSFTISFLASFLEDLIFFGLLGIITLYVSVRKPEEEEFDLRIRSLANGRDVTKEAEEYLTHEIKNLLSFNELMEVTVIVNAFDLQEEIIDLTVIQTKLITNMCKDVKNRVKSVVTVEPGAYDEHGVGAEITYYATRDEHNEKNSKVHINEQVEKVTREQGTYTYPEKELVITEGSKVEWKLAYRILGKFGNEQGMGSFDNWLNINANRFTKKCSLVIQNNAATQEALPIHIKAASRKPVAEKIRLSSKDKEYKKSFTVYFKPNDHLSLYFEKPNI